MIKLRPVALIGFTMLAVLLAAQLLSPAVYLPLAATFLSAGIFLLVYLRLKKGATKKVNDTAVGSDASCGHDKSDTGCSEKAQEPPTPSSFGTLSSCERGAEIACGKTALDEDTDEQTGPATTVCKSAAESTAVPENSWIKRCAVLALLLVTTGVALLRLVLISALAVEPTVQHLDGSIHTVDAVVYDTGSGLYAGVHSLRVRVIQLDGNACSPFFVYCPAAGDGAVGDEIRLQIEFEPLPISRQLYYYSRGVYLQGSVQGEIQITGTSNHPSVALTRLRNAIGARFLGLGQTDGGIAAAILAGDRSHLDSEVRRQFANAGVAHILVVSGLHLSLAAGLLYAVAGLLFRRRRSVLRFLPAILGVLGYMLLTGLTVSVVRAGVLALMALVAEAVHRESDTMTSLGLALIILLMVNPYAACDTALLLSFSATLGLMTFSGLNIRHFRLYRLGFAPLVWLVTAAGSAAFAMMFTLPVLAWQGTEISAATLLCNLLCVPLVAPIMVTGVVYLLVGLLPFASLTALAGVPFAFLLHLLTGAVNWCNALPLHRFGVCGAMACIILCVAGLATVCIYHSRFQAWCAAVGAVVLVTLSLLLWAVNINTVKVALVGTGLNPAVVLSENQLCTVLFRGPLTNIDAVQEYLRLHNLPMPTTVIDFDSNDNTAALQEAFGKVDFTVECDILYIEEYQCLPDVFVVMQRQKTGNLCVICADGQSVGVTSGKVDCSACPPFDVFLAGRSTVTAPKIQMVLKNQKEYAWIEQLAAQQPSLEIWAQDEPVLLIRPGKAIRILEGVWA